jgi:hypothetical protein
MALFIRRVETVVSLQQLVAEDAPLSSSSDVSLGPDAAVAKIAGARLPRYLFAGDAAPRMSRLNSSADLARVPDVDMDDTHRWVWCTMCRAGMVVAENGML